MFLRYRVRVSVSVFFLLLKLYKLDEPYHLTGSMTIKVEIHDIVFNMILYILLANLT